MHPVLNMCQEMAKHCLRSGQAFSISGSSTGGITFSTPGLHFFPRNSRIRPSPTFSKKAKTPSQRRRDQRRWNEHKLKKTSPAAGISPATELPKVSETVSVVAESPSTPNSSPSQVVEPPPPTKATPSPSLEKDLTPMEVDFQPPLISPISSPTLVETRPPAQPEFPEDLDVEAPLVVTIESESEKSAIISLRRTLKKCNLKSLTPGNVYSKEELGQFGYNINVPSKRFKHVIHDLNKNWISVDNAFIIGFHLKRQDGTQFRLPQYKTLNF